jgi:hypothetical protein
MKIRWTIDLKDFIIYKEYVKRKQDGDPMNQYLMLISEDTLQHMAEIFRGVQFMPIEGMNIEQNPGYKLLVVPPADAQIEEPADTSLTNTEPAADV